MYLASWEHQDLSVTHKTCVSTEWLVFPWTFQHRRFFIDLSWVEPSTSVHQQQTNIHHWGIFKICLPASDGRHRLELLWRRVALKEDFCTKMKINFHWFVIHGTVNFVHQQKRNIHRWDKFKICLPASDGRHRLELFWRRVALKEDFCTKMKINTRTKLIPFDWWFCQQLDLSLCSGHTKFGNPYQSF